MLIVLISLQVASLDSKAIVAAIQKKRNEAQATPVYSVEQSFYGELNTPKGNTVWVSRSITITDLPGTPNRLVHTKMLPVKNQVNKTEDITGQNNVYKFVVRRESDQEKWKLVSLERIKSDVKVVPVQEFSINYQWQLYGEAFSMLDYGTHYHQISEKCVIDGNSIVLSQLLKPKDATTKNPISNCEITLNTPDYRIANYTIERSYSDGNRTIKGVKTYNENGLLAREKKDTRFKNNTDTSTDEVNFTYGTTMPSSDVFKLSHYGLAEPVFDTDKFELPWFVYISAVGALFIAGAVVMQRRKQKTIHIK